VALMLVACALHLLRGRLADILSVAAGLLLVGGALYLLGPALRCGALRAVELPALSQPDYDHLLWAADLNFVRGEDSMVRAQWAQKPFVWHIYPQQEDAHRIKLDAFLARLLDGLAPDAAEACRATWHAWNGDGDLRTYKIHLGSGNVLMEPNGQYLCIVPTRGARRSSCERAARMPTCGSPDHGDTKASCLVTGWCGSSPCCRMAARRSRGRSASARSRLRRW